MVKDAELIIDDDDGLIGMPVPMVSSVYLKKRGKGIDWIELEDENHDEIVFATFEDVQHQVNRLNLSKIGEKNEKVYRYRCRVKGCSHKVRFTKRNYTHIKGFVSSSHGEHNHNQGHGMETQHSSEARGLSGLQKKHVRQAFNLGIRSAGQILKYFERERHKSAEPSSFPEDPDKTKLTNYASSLKKKVTSSIPGAEKWYTGPEILKLKTGTPSAVAPESFDAILSDTPFTAILGDGSLADNIIPTPSSAIVVSVSGAELNYIEGTVLYTKEI